MQDYLTTELKKYNPLLTETELEVAFSLFEEKEYQGNSIISSAGEICDHLFIAKNSITKCYYLNEKGEEHTLWMKSENNFITEFKSFTTQEKSQFSLMLYEDTTVYMISRANLNQLYTTSINWANFGIKLMESVHVTLIDVFVNLLANDATRNYQYIEYMFPRFIQVAPLKDIASMLQVSPVTLSRIRAGKQLKNT